MSARKDRNAVGSRSVDTGEKIVHAPGGQAGYHTLCGVSLNDSEFVPFDVAINARFNCQSCHALFEHCRGMRVTDFAKELK